MTTLTDLAADVYTLTNRPDLVNETNVALRAATLKMHQSDFYYKDLVEKPIVFSSAAYNQSFQYKSLFPQWRAVKYLRKVDPVTFLPGTLLQLLTPDEILDGYGYQKQDVFYVAGQDLQINSSTQQANFIIGFYQHPTVVAATYSSWIADEFPFAIIFEACATIFKAIGFDEQEAVYRTLSAEQITLIKMSNIVANGY